MIEQLILSPKFGTHIGNDCYKIRLSIASKVKGKSGGARVVTYVVVEETAVFLLTIYDKSEQNNITDKELLDLLKTLK